MNTDEHRSVLANRLGADSVIAWLAGEIFGYFGSGLITAVILGALAALSHTGRGWPRIVLIVVVMVTALKTHAQFFASLETAWGDAGIRPPLAGRSGAVVPQAVE